MKKSRTTYTIYNFISSIGGQLITIIMQFIVRTVFITTLGKSYLGLSGLFSNILSMLSLAEFGVGSAILFKLYEPIAKNDKRRITVLMKFYKTAYRIIGIAVALMGLSLIPFFPALIDDYERFSELNINIIVVFLLYLFEAVSSYLFFAYKSAIIKADQKEYLLNIVNYVFTIVVGVLQIICLYLFPSFEIYVLLSILRVVVQNLIGGIIADRMYPYIKEDTTEKITIDEIKGLIKDCSALFLYKLNVVVVSSTDNIILASFLGLDIVGMYSNYYIFYTTIHTLLNKIFNSVSHSLGNLHTDKDTKHEYKIFEITMLIAAVLGGTAFVGVFVVADELVNVWIGADWLIRQPFAFLLGLELYTMSFKLILGKYRTAMGLFQQAKFRPVASMIINLIVSILLVNVLGIQGVLIGTILSDWLTFMWYDPMIIHRHGFRNMYSVGRYYIRFLKNFLISCVVGIIDWFICSNFMVGYGWISVVVHAIICGISVPIILLLCAIRTEEGQYICNLMRTYISKIKKKVNL